MDPDKITEDEITINEVKSDTQETAYDPSLDAATTNNTKYLLIIVAVVIGIFAISLGGFKLFDSPTSGAVVNIDTQFGLCEQDVLNDREGYKYNGYCFVKVDGLWWTKRTTQNRQILTRLHFGPKQVENIPLTGSLTNEFNRNSEVYIAIDPDVEAKFYTLGVYELSFNVAQGINRDLVPACTKKNEACKDEEILNCENAKGHAVIELAYGTENKVELMGSCIKISGNELTFVESIDRALLKWYGIMN